MASGTAINNFVPGARMSEIITTGRPLEREVSLKDFSPGGPAGGIVASGSFAVNGIHVRLTPQGRLSCVSELVRFYS